jgi:hypothetical protein
MAKINVTIQATIYYDDSDCDSLDTLQDKFDEGGDVLMTVESELGDVEVILENITVTRDV